MFEVMAGMLIYTKIHFQEMKIPFIKKKDRIVAEQIYHNEIKKLEETEKYEKSKYADSGYMTREEEYESKSRAKTKKDMTKDIKGGEVPKDSNMVYVPQKTFKLVKYNDPIGSPELSLPRKLNFDRQINAQGIISGDRTMMVYPAVYYYAQSDCTACDLFLIKLDPNLNDTQKAIYANVVQRVEEPLISTEKNIDTKFIFRTLTPIDFSADNKKLVVKEKVGHKHDGIWKTDLWIVQFEQQQAIKIPQIREAIINYWASAGGVDFEENRWDIYPMGFDANDDNRIIICAYAYTGDVPKFLGTWSIDIYGENAKLEDLKGYDFPVSVIGYRLAEDSVKDASEIEFEAKQAKEKEKKEKKISKEASEFEQDIKKLELKRKLHQMDMETLFKVEQRKNELKLLKQKKTSNDGVTGLN